jgi:hypothetical protein
MKTQANAQHGLRPAARGRKGASASKAGGLPWPLLILMGYLTSLAFEGPTRTLLSVVRMENLLYIRDLLAILMIIAACRVKPDFGGAESGNGLIHIVVYLALCHAVLGLWLGNQVAPVLFALKIFVALVFGLAVAKHVQLHERVFANFLVVLFVGSVIGVYVNALIGEFPWEGQEYDTAFGAVKGTKVWWAGGERRLAGFARASYSAASAIGIGGVFLSAYLERNLWKWVVFFVGMPAIYLTTSKGVIISYFLVSIWAIWVSAGRVRTPTGQFGASGAWLAYLFCAISFAAPLISAYVSPSSDLVRTAPSNLSSFADRAAVTWPSAFRDIDGWWEWIAGFGLGGVGSPLRFSLNSWRFNPVDNMTLYLYLNFGVLGLVYYMYLVKKVACRIASVRESDIPFELGLMAVGLLVISYGITTQIIEDPLVTIIFGVAVAYVSKKNMNAPKNSGGQDV